jgi:hypothetical protein
MPWDLTWLEFFKGFWPNFVAAIVTGGIIGVFFSWWITKKIGNELNTKERQLVILSEKLEKNIKTEQYYQIIQTEIDKVNKTTANTLPSISLKTFLDVSLISFDCPVWDILEKSGELPKYLTPIDIRKMVKYFYLINISTKLANGIFEIINNSNEYRDIQKRTFPIIQELITSLENSVALGESLILEIDSQLLILREEKKVINTNIEKLSK